MGKLKVGVITVNDGCSLNDEVDLVGPELIRMINEGELGRCEVVKTCIMPQDINLLKRKLTEWCDTDSIHLILTVGGLEGDCVKRATLPVLERQFPGILKQLQSIPFENPDSIVCGFRRCTVVVNLPGHVTTSKCCLRLIENSIKNSIFLLTGFGYPIPRQTQ